MRKSFYKMFAALCFVLAAVSFAQTGTIQGQITDEAHLSLPGANVFIVNTQIGTVSDDNGNFRLDRVPVGQYELKVQFIGYLAQTQSIVVNHAKTTKVDFQLEPGVLEMDQVFVVGDRLKGQAKALNQQKTNFNITNIVSADQIGRFPDQNIGDALKRIPSITVNYDQGEARFANIRGTAPELSLIAVNGESVPSAEGETRAVQLDLIPSDMIQSIEVNKAVTPDMDADAIGGSINLITRQAPNSRRMSVTLGSGYNTLSEKMIKNGSFILGDRFADNKLGVVVSGSVYDHDFGSDNTEGTWAVADDGTFYPDEWDIRAYHVRRMRQSISGAIDYKINDNNTLFFNTMYNHRNDWEGRFRLQYKLEEPDENGVSQETEIRRQLKGGVDDNDNRRLEDQRTQNYSLSGKHVAFSDWKIDWSATYSKASEERPHERYLMWRIKDAPVSVDLSDVTNPYFYEEFSPNDFSFKELTEEYQLTEEHNTKAKLDIEIPLHTTGDYQNSIKFGAKYKAKDKSRDNNFFEYEPLDEDAFDNMAMLPMVDQTDDNFLAGDYQVGQFTAPTYLGGLDLKDASQWDESDVPAEYAADNYDATENVTAGYIQYDQKIGSQLSFKVGLRIEDTQVDYNGYEFDENEETIIATYGDDNYTNFLPGLHVKYDLNDDTILRFAYTNTIARPRYYDLVPYRAISEDYEELEVGNSNLKPTKSMNFDVMAEHYFKSVGVISGGVFYKDIQDFIYVHNENNYTDPISGQVFEDFFQPRNGANAQLFGFEFAFQRQLTFLPSVLKNLGLYVNYNYTYSETENPALSDKKMELPGTAPHTLNTNLSYQTKRMVLGVSFNFTSAYLDPDETDLTPGLERYYDQVTYLDFNGSYAITPQLRFYAEANNLLNQPLRYYAGDRDRTYQQEYYNRRMTAGLKYDF